METVYIAWVNAHERNTRTFPDRHSEEGGITHLPADIRAKVFTPSPRRVNDRLDMVIFGDSGGLDVHTRMHGILLFVHASACCVICVLAKSVGVGRASMRHAISML